MADLLEIKKLNIYFGETHVVKDLDFELNSKEILGIVGESGSGKSLTSLAIMNLLSPMTTVNGKIKFKEKSTGKTINLLGQKNTHPKISMIFQEPMTSLNPSMRCGKQVEEAMEINKLQIKNRKEKVLSLFEEVLLPDPERIYKAYPHELSGGQKQRVMIAMALAKEPDILIADEPTTALDVTVQRKILELLKDLREKKNLSILFISHDLGVISQLCDKVVVMYRGDKVEEGSVKEIFYTPKKLYTKGLIACRPQLNQSLKRLPTVSDFLENPDFKAEPKDERAETKRQMEIYRKEPLLEFKNVDKFFESNSGWFGKKKIFKGIDNVSFDLYRGESLGLVGESGSGKTTLSRALMMLKPPNRGSILYKGKDLMQMSKNELRKLRKEIQIIFQDPFSSLNPVQTIHEIITTPLQVHEIGKSSAERKLIAERLLERVNLPINSLKKYPHEFSGGQKQRIGIARALALNPELIVCDESVSALDVSVQAQVLNLLADLQKEYNLTYLFISHDLSVVKHFCDRILVLQKGVLVEEGMSDDIYKNPREKYTKDLIEAIPVFK